MVDCNFNQVRRCNSPHGTKLVPRGVPPNLPRAIPTVNSRIGEVVPRLLVPVLDGSSALGQLQSLKWNDGRRETVLHRRRGHGRVVNPAPPVRERQCRHEMLRGFGSHEMDSACTPAAMSQAIRLHQFLRTEVEVAFAVPSLKPRRAGRRCPSPIAFGNSLKRAASRRRPVRCRDTATFPCAAHCARDNCCARLRPAVSAAVPGRPVFMRE